MVLRTNTASVQFIGASSQTVKGHLPAKAVQCAALPLERVDNVHGCDGLAASMLLQAHGQCEII